MLDAEPEAIIAWHQDRLLRLTRDLEQKATRQVAANVQRANNGVHQGRVGYGYRREGSAMVIEPDEAATIREGVRRALAGDSLRTICKDFDARHVPTPGRGARWNSTTLKQLLLRPSLAGLTVHRGKVLGNAPDGSPRVIDEDTHHRIRAVLTDPSRRSGTPGRAPKYLLGGIARCGRCGGVMARAVGRNQRQANGNIKRQPPSYVCTECHRVRRKQSDVDALVESIVVGRLQMPDAAQMFAQGDPAELTEAQKRAAAVDARLINAADMYAAGTIEGAQLARITEGLRSERDAAEAAVRASMPPAIPAELLGAHASKVWQRLDMDAKRAVLRLLVEVIVLPSGSGRSFDPDSVRIEWKN